ncbi:MAG: glycosyltransferase family 4 protein [Mariniblastus sp.]|nr:glycosyltransferase family 4 protein [Mariniblastus sp.]
MSRRVLLLGEYGWRNGGENSFLAIAPSLIQQGFEFVAAVPAGTEFSTALAELGCDLVDLQLFHRDQRKSQEQIRIDLDQLVRSVQPDLVHCNSLSTSRLAGPVTRAANVPSVGYLRDILRLSAKAIQDISEMDQLVAVSRATRDYHVAAGIPAGKVEVIYNGVDLEQFAPRSGTGSLQAERGIPTGDRIILCVGQIGIRKGTEIVLDSFSRLAAKDPSLQLFLAGDRHSKKQEAIEYEKQLKATSASSSCSSRIHWLGRIDGIPNLMNEAVLLLHAAHQEPLGRVLLEAAASGLPFVATRVGGTPEIVEGTGIELVPAGDTAEMCRVAQRILECPGEERRTARELRDQAVHRFSLRQCAEKIGNLYRQQLGT